MPSGAASVLGYLKLGLNVMASATLSLVTQDGAVHVQLAYSHLRWEEVDRPTQLIWIFLSTNKYKRHNRAGRRCSRGTRIVRVLMYWCPSCYRLYVKKEKRHQCFVSGFPGWRDPSLYSRTPPSTWVHPPVLESSAPPKFKHKGALPLRYGYKQVTILALSSVSPFLVFLLHHQ